jgi:hypothetical protein
MAADETGAAGHKTGVHLGCSSKDWSDYRCSIAFRIQSKIVTVMGGPQGSHDEGK